MSLEMNKISGLTVAFGNEYNFSSDDFIEAIAEQLSKRIPSAIGKWPTVNDVVRTKYCPHGKKKLIALIKRGVIKGGQLDDKNRTWFVDRESLDRHMQSLLHKCIDEKHIGAILEAI